MIERLIGLTVCRRLGHGRWRHKRVGGRWCGRCGLYEEAWPLSNQSGT